MLVLDQLGRRVALADEFSNERGTTGKRSRDGDGAGFGGTKAAMGGRSRMNVSWLLTIHEA